MSQQRVTSVISSHGWNSECTILAVCPNNNEIHLYEVVSGENTLSRTTTLQQHRQLVSSISWNRGGSFVSCSHDSTAFVWSLEGDRWTPEPVFTRLKLAALCVRWSPCGGKLAIASGEKRICISHYEKEQKRWVSKPFRRCHSSSVVAIAWHPGGALLASTSTDGRCKIFNAALPGIDGQGQAPGAFGDVLIDVEAGIGWGHAVAWSPSGCQLVVSSHGPALQFLCGLYGSSAASLQPEAAGRQLLHHVQLPLRCVAFLSETSVVGAGFDGQVFLFERDGEGVWSYARSLSPEPAMRIDGGGRRGAISAAFSAKLAMFRSPAKKDRTREQPLLSAEGAAAVAPGHDNAVVDLQVFTDAAGTPTGRFSTAGWDGRVLLWDAGKGATETEESGEGRAEGLIKAPTGVLTKHCPNRLLFDPVGTCD
ncbi:g3231 [Coccomyxa elongata]